MDLVLVFGLLDNFTSEAAVEIRNVVTLLIIVGAIAAWAANRNRPAGFLAMLLPLVILAVIVWTPTLITEVFADWVAEQFG